MKLYFGLYFSYKDTAPIVANQEFFDLPLS
jgi:hypothetical protein